jgi:hypothetical protein
LRHLVPIAALMLLTGCQKQAEEEQNELSANEIAAQLEGLKIDPGQWESTTRILSASGPLPAEALQRMTGQTTKVSNCITPEQAARPSANFLAAQQNSDCTYQEFSMEGGRLTGRMTCSGGNLPGDMVTVMNGSYAPTSYDMTMDMQTAGLPGGITMTIKARTQGRRVGDCA